LLGDGALLARANERVATNGDEDRFLVHWAPATSTDRTRNVKSASSRR
jgi:hypothetical protein